MVTKLLLKFKAVFMQAEETLEREKRRLRIQERRLRDEDFRRRQGVLKEKRTLAEQTRRLRQEEERMQREREKLRYVYVMSEFLFCNTPYVWHVCPMMFFLHCLMCNEKNPSTEDNYGSI